MRLNISDLFKAKASKSRVSGFLNFDPLEDSNLIKLDQTISKIQVHHLSFSYEEGQTKNWIFENLNFEANTTCDLVITGPSGSGKSTLVNILMKMEESYGGAVQINGIDLRNIDETSLHQRMVIVTQESELLNSTLRENLQYSGKKISDEEIEIILNELQLGYLLKEVPGGIDWNITKDKRSLSDGEKKGYLLLEH